MHYFTLGLTEWRCDDGLVEKRLLNTREVQKDGLLKQVNI